MLLKLVEGLSSRFDPLVVSLADTRGGLADDYRATGVPLEVLDLRGIGSAPTSLALLVRIVRRFRPAVISTWLYHSDLFGGMAARIRSAQRCLEHPQYRAARGPDAGRHARRHAPQCAAVARIAQADPLLLGGSA